MLQRNKLKRITHLTNTFAAVGILGSRQTGKTTLAKQVAKGRQSTYLDLENPLDFAKLDDPLRYFTDHSGQLIILDEIQRKPELFPVLRGVIDANRESGRKTGQFLILGSASIDLLRQSSESLAGRIVYEELSTITLLEYGQSIHLHWLRGGYPDSLLASTDPDSFDWSAAFITTYLERDIPQFGPRVPATTMRRLWTMLAHHQGSPLNASQLASAMGVSAQTVLRYVDLLCDLFLVRRLQPFHQNVGKRLVKAPKIYVRDSGVVHSLLNLTSYEALLSHPIAGMSWEGYVIENILAVLPKGCEVTYYRSSGGAEIDLVIDHADSKRLAIEIKKASVPKLERGFYEACKDVQPHEKYVVYQGEESFYLRDEVMAIALTDLMRRVAGNS
jgi:hypothetical protein